MHDDAFDQVTLEGVRGVPRRGLLGLAAGLSALAMGRPVGEARHKKRKKCKRGATKCGKKCVNLTTNSANCGACGTACSVGKICIGGACSCPAGQSFIAETCIPRFGCTLELDTCEVGKKACPEITNVPDARCYLSPEGEPFCATALNCEAVPVDGACTKFGGDARILIPCILCTAPGETGACVLPIVQKRAQP